jgi:putative restriction endonuclease
MNRERLLSDIKNMNIWKKHDQRAPHKPLLILYALAQLQTNQKQWLDYRIVSEDLRRLLIDFGPYRKSYHPEQPFVRLANDGIWQLEAKGFTSSISIQDLNIKDKWLKTHDTMGGFNDDVFQLLKADKNLIREIAEMLLDMHFPESLHEDILSAVGLDISYSNTYTLTKVSKRDPAFREKILRAYGYSCAVCGFNVRLGHKLVGVEAAHIKWHQAGGPDIENNGIALCSMHHKLYDLGVFTINTEHNIIVSQNAHGTQGLEDWLLRYHSQKLTRPIQNSYTPELEFLDWNVREVFKGTGRY